MLPRHPLIQPSTLRRIGVGAALALFLGLIYAPGALAGAAVGAAGGPLGRAAALVTLFLSIFLEALPFLLLGTLTSGLVGAFFAPADLARLVPSNRWTAALAGGLLGLFFPVAGVGVAPLARRLLRAGLPAGAGAAFLLAAPALNPIAILAALAAAPAGALFWGRLGLAFLAALPVGIPFGLHAAPRELYLPEEPSAPEPVEPSGWRARLSRGLEAALDELVEFGAWLAGGALLTAGLQLLIPQAALLAPGRPALGSVLTALVLGSLYSPGAAAAPWMTVPLAGSFATGPLLAYLAGATTLALPALALLPRVFRPRAALYLALLGGGTTVLVALAAAVVVGG